LKHKYLDQCEISCCGLEGRLQNEAYEKFWRVVVAATIEHKQVRVSDLICGQDYKCEEARSVENAGEKFEG